MPATPGPSSLKRPTSERSELDDQSRELKKAKRDAVTTDKKKRGKKKKRKTSVVQILRTTPAGTTPTAAAVPLPEEDGDGEEEEEHEEETAKKEDKGKGRAVDTEPEDHQRAESPTVAENQLTTLIVASTSDRPSTSAQAEAQAAEIARLRAQLAEQTTVRTRFMIYCCFPPDPCF